jgi:hypothetical protein
VLAGVPAGPHHLDTGPDLAVSFMELDDAGIPQRQEVVRQVAGAIALVRMRGVFPLGSADDVGGAAEARHDDVAQPRGRAAEVVEVEVRGKDDVDRVRGEAAFGQRVIERDRPVERVDVALLRVHLVAGAAVDEHAAPVRFHQQRPHRQLDAVALVGRRQPLPQRPRHDAEHGAAIEPEGAVVQHGQLHVAERQRPCPQVHAVPGRFLQLDEHAVRGRRVDEGDDGALGARPRLLVDQADAARLQLRQRRADVVHPQRHVMQPGTALVGEPGDWRIGRRRFQQLQRGAAGGDEVRTHALRGDFLGADDVEAERVAVEGQRGVDVLHRNTDVIEDGFHGMARVWKSGTTCASRSDAAE